MLVHALALIRHSNRVAGEPESGAPHPSARKSVAVTGPAGFPCGRTTGETGASGAPQTVIVAAAVAVVSPFIAKAKVTVDGPGTADEDAWNEKAAGANAGGERIAETGVTVMPGRSPDGVTVTSTVGTQVPGTSDAVIVAGAPPAFRRTPAGVAEGVKSAGWTFTENHPSVLMPRGSLTSARTPRVPGFRPGAAVTVKVTTLEGGTEGTEIVEGEMERPAGSEGNVTVGVPAYPSSEETVSEFGVLLPPGQILTDPRSTSTPMRPGRVTVRARGTVFESTVDEEKVSPALTVPAALELDAESVKTTGV